MDATAGVGGRPRVRKRQHRQVLARLMSYGLKGTPGVMATAMNGARLCPWVPLMTTPLAKLQISRGYQGVPWRCSRCVKRLTWQVSA